MTDIILNDMEISAIGEVGNICFGNAMTTLGVLVHNTIDLSIPKVEIRSKDEIITDNKIGLITAKVDYVKGVQGSSILFLKEDDVKMITDLMMGSDGYGMFYQQDLSEIHLSAASEAMNQMMGASATAMGIMLDRLVDISTPTTEKIERVDALAGKFADEHQFAHITFEIKVGDLIITDIVQLFPLKLAKAIADLFIIKKGQKAE